MMTLVPMERSDTPVARLRNFFLLATAFIGTTALSGCAHIDTRKSGQIDLAERTMTVPANRFGFDARLVLKISGRHSLEAIVPAFNKALQNGA